MRYVAAFFRAAAFTVVLTTFTACATTGSRAGSPEPGEFIPEREPPALSDFGVLLRAYPSRRPYRLDDSIVLEVFPIQNFSGEDGLPPDFSTVVTTIVSSIGVPVASKPPISFREREVPYGVRSIGPEADLTIRGSVTEGEKRLTEEFNREMDVLFGGNGKNAVDIGGSKGKASEVRTLALDLHLVDKRGLVVEAVSHRVDVVRRGETYDYGLFFRGSGIGVRGRKLVAQSNSQALRIAGQQSVLVLLGRYLRVPYWRAAGGGPDQELIDRYRAILESGEAPEDFRLLLFAHGVDLSFNSYTFSESEVQAVAALKNRLGLTAEISDVDLAIHLWHNVPYSQKGSRLNDLRRILSSKAASPPPSHGRSMLDLISKLRPGEELYIPIHFDYETSLLSEPAKTVIDQFVEAFKISKRDNEDWWIELRGHGDERGELTKIQELSEKRAVRVQTYLEQKHRLPKGRIFSAGFGSTEPLEKDASTEEQFRQNRRVEILLVMGKRPTSG